MPRFVGLPSTNTQHPSQSTNSRRRSHPHSVRRPSESADEIEPRPPSPVMAPTTGGPTHLPVQPELLEAYGSLPFKESKPHHRRAPAAAFDTPTKKAPSTAMPAKGEAVEAAGAARPLPPTPPPSRENSIRAGQEGLGAPDSSSTGGEASSTTSRTDAPTQQQQQQLQSDNTPAAMVFGAIKSELDAVQATCGDPYEIEEPLSDQVILVVSAVWKNFVLPSWSC